MTVVVVIFGVAKYNSGIGVISAFSGGTFGFIGEVIDGQLPPPMVQLLMAAGVSSIFEPRVVRLPSDEAISQFLDGDRFLLSIPTDINSIECPQPTRLFKLPRSWLLYFLDPLSPAKALKMRKRLVALLPTADDRDEANSNWLECAFVSSTSAG